MRFRFSPAVCFLLCVLASAVYAEGDMPRLRLDRTFLTLPPSSEETPIFVSAQRLEKKEGNQIEATGEVELRTSHQSITADHALYSQMTKDLVADGAVRLEQDGNVAQGPHLKLNLATDMGDMAQPVFQLGENHARGNASILHIEDRQNYVLRNVTYTTCPADNDDWLLKMSELDIDRNRQIGEAYNAHVEFMGVPILYTPWMDFPLNNQRKSGFLGPVFGGTVTSGTIVKIPYYLNIAPNYDATLAPQIMSKRGILFNNEFRYLGPSYVGEIYMDSLPNDRLAKRSRLRQSLKHAQNFGGGISGAANLNRVSDDAYFRDLADTLAETSQVQLVREGTLSYSESWWGASVRAQNFQTLQDPAAPVAAPYRRLPQVNIGAQRTMAKTNASFSGEFVDFRHAAFVNGQRTVLYPSASYPLVTDPAFYLTPKFGLHHTHYSLGANNPGMRSSLNRTVPIFSLDSGMILERDGKLAEQDYVQTLEPRLFYVYIPYRSQSQLPNFDTAQADFSFAQMFTENRFVGNDRVGDANHVTLAVTSRVLGKDSGVERLRVTVGQRYSIQPPRVNLVAPTATTNKSDILLETAGQLTPAWSLGGDFQYNPNQKHSEKFNAAAHFQPEGGKVFNLGYRFTRNSVRQVDVSAQWPLSKRWHGMGRWNFSLQDHRQIEVLGGLEYNEDCWTTRLVAQRFVTATHQFSTSFFVQLELKEFVRIGPDPLAVLGQSVPGYTPVNPIPHDGPPQGLR